jgi:phytoene dehydrogenase-like protein
MSYGRLLRETFESEEMRAALAWLAAQSGPPPTEPGGGPFAGWHAAVHEVGAHRAKGGSGMLSVALRRALEAMGGEVRTDAPAAKILVEKNGRASGVILRSGEVVRAKCVVAACHVLTTFQDLLAPEDVPNDLLRRLRAVTIGNGFGMTVRCAATQLPDYGCGTPCEAHHGMQLLCPSLDYLSAAYADYATGIPSKKPAVLAMTFTALDPGLAPPGRHTIQCWSQYFPYKRSDGRVWDEDARQEAADSILDVLYSYAPNMRGAITDTFIQSPLDLERTLGLRNGNVMHVEMSLDQMFAMRPLPELSEYKTPIDGLYLTGASMHPVREGQLLELPEEAQELHLEPGQEIQIQLHRADAPEPARTPNEAGLAALRKVAELKKGMPESDPSQTDRIIREGRAGAMYGYPPIE